MGEHAHPGPRPALFAFPFEEARIAQEAMEDAGERLRIMISRHEAAFARAAVDFEGSTRE